MRIKFTIIPHSTPVKPYLWFGSFVGLVVTNQIYLIEANPVSPSAGAQLPQSAGSLLRWRLQPGSDERLSFVISLWQCASVAALRACAQSAFACLNDWLNPEPLIDRLARVLLPARRCLSYALAGALAVWWTCAALVERDWLIRRTIFRTAPGW